MLLQHVDLALDGGDNVVREGRLLPVLRSGPFQDFLRHPELRRQPAGAETERRALQPVELQLQPLPAGGTLGRDKMLRPFGGGLHETLQEFPIGAGVHTEPGANDIAILQRLRPGGMAVDEVDFLNDIGPGIGLHNILADGEQRGLLHGGPVIEGGAEDDRNRLEMLIGAHPRDQTESVQAGHPDVKQAEIKWLGGPQQFLPGFLAIADDGERMTAVRFKDQLNQQLGDAIVFRDQDFHGRNKIAAARPRKRRKSAARPKAAGRLRWICGRFLQTSPFPMNPVLKLLLEGGSLGTAQMAQVLNLTEGEINGHLEQLKKEHIFLGWRPVLDLSKEAAGAVRAVIEVRITPERGGGFNRLAERISRFDEVESCYLMSGGYDLLVFVTGSSLQKVAAFVSEKLSTIEGVISTSTHFMLRSYKEQGYLMDVPAEQNERLTVTP